jgi:hypothetical protein
MQSLALEKTVFSNGSVFALCSVLPSRLERAPADAAATASEVAVTGAAGTTVVAERAGIDLAAQGAPFRLAAPGGAPTVTPSRVASGARVRPPRRRNHERVYVTRPDLVPRGGM